MKIVKTFFLCFLSFASFGQTNLLFHNVDTLKSSYRVGGALSDSMDLYFSEKQTTLPGGTQNNPFGIHGNDYFNFFQSLPKQYRSIKIASPVFTALPHLGFTYSFGSGGLQFLHTEYQQTLRGNIHVAMHYNRQVSATLYKNSGFSSDVFTLSLSRYGKYWKHLIEGSSSNFTRELNGGVVLNDKMLNEYGIEYAPVQKSNAQDTSNRFLIHHQSVWNILKNDSSSTIETGFTFNNLLRVDRRIFKETDSISKIYPFFINPTSSRDLSQWSFMENGVGYFLKTKISTSEFGVNRVYWIYKTNASQIKNEINITFTTQWKLGKTQVNYAMMQNLVGQGNQFSHTVFLNNKQEKGSHNLELSMSQLVPEPFQRLYFGNTIGWNMPKIEKQGVKVIAYSYEGKSHLKPFFKLGYKQLQNTYFLLNDTWRNDTLSDIQQLYISASCNLHAGKFFLQPRITFNHLSNKSQLLPAYDLRARVFWKSKIKNKQKYEVVVGSEIYSRSKYTLLDFDNRLSAFTISNPTNKQYTSVVQLDAFLGITIDEMRFYFKYENMDSYWNPVTNRIATNYPVMPRILRIGLTWDFLN